MNIIRGALTVVVARAIQGWQTHIAYGSAKSLCLRRQGSVENRDTRPEQTRSPPNGNRRALRRAPMLEPSRAARGQLNLRRTQDAYDRGNSRRQRRRISDGRLWWPLDQYRGGRVGRLDQLHNESIGSGDRAGRQESI